MTRLLHDLMHDRAAEAGVPELDLDRITREGERRARRRRTALVGGVAAAALVVGATTAAITSGPDAPETVVADGTAADPVELGWVTGDTLHRPGRPDVDLGTDVRAWVWAGDSIVFTDTDRRVHVWRDGDSTVVGRAAGPEWDGGVELVADGSRVAWLDPVDGFTSLDTTSGDPVSLPAQPLEESEAAYARVTAMDEGVVYAVDRRGVFGWDSDTGEVTVLDTGWDTYVIDAEAGSVLRAAAGDDRGATLVTATSEVDVPTDEFANISPDGARISSEYDDAGIVIDAATGDRLTFDHGHEWALGYQWLDDTTLAVMAFDGIEESSETTWLLTCDATSGACDGSGTELSPAGIGSFQLPIGVHFQD